MQEPIYKALIVGGIFDRGVGKASSIVRRLSEETGWACVNGGNLERLRGTDIAPYDTLLWMPNIDNDEEKLLSGIKARHPRLTLISSKRIIEKSYTDADVVGRLLKSHSNLGIAIRRDGARYTFRILDPLGNVYGDTDSIPEMARILKERIGFIRSLTRIGSKPIAPALMGGIDVDTKFIDIVRIAGDAFSRHVNAVNPERFLGNASLRMTDRTTRCCHGFPAFRETGSYLVSRRNVDKEKMGPADFVRVSANEAIVEYEGELKPSVDAPIQIRLFNHYPDVNFMIHGHVYVEGAPMTADKVPCGHIEEFEKVRRLFPSREAHNFSVNLRGHGCLILARDMEYLQDMIPHFRSRQFPEP